MRCALRLDPDIIMLGEIRDIQTAKFAFRLALTGRQVYTTGHVYAAMATPKRLRDIGIEPYIVYDPHLVRGMICQRLLRTMCMECRIPLAQALTEMGPMYKDLARRLRAGLSHVCLNLILGMFIWPMKMAAQNASRVVRVVLFVLKLSRRMPS
jgi:type II secretory ATPase GspE/PulE/Tfp pilus assembly ATPase PilB-like protein